MEASHGASDAERTGKRKCPECGTVYPDDGRYCSIDGFALILDGAPPDIIGTILGNKYRVERLIGSGAMGDVYQVRHVRLDQVRAVKRMHSSTVQDIDTVERFRREARQQGKIRHPNVATLYDFEEESDGSCFLVMEYVDGKPLADVISESGRVPAARVAVLVSQMASALDAAHDEGVVHRDLKPDNVLVATARDGSDRVKVVDFGIATLIEPQSARITSTGFVVGTPRYMSPEQLLPTPGEFVDGRSDVYTLALVTVEMLLGHLPFGNRDLADIMKRATMPPPLISKASTEVRLPDAIDAIFERALAVHRDERYGTAGEFARELVGVLAAAGLAPTRERLPKPTPLAMNAIQRPSPQFTTPVETPVQVPATTRPSTPVPSSKWSDRSKIFMIAGTAALLGIAAWMGYSKWEIGKSGPSNDGRDSAAVADSLRNDSIRNSKKVVSPADSARADSVKRFAFAAARIKKAFNSEPKDSVSAARRIETVNALLPWLRARSDSVEAGLIVVEALLAMDNVDEICRRLPALRVLSNGVAPDLSRTVRMYADTIPCGK